MNKNWKLFLSFGAFVILAGLGSVFIIGNHKDASIAISDQGQGVVAGATSSEGWIMWTAMPRQKVPIPTSVSGETLLCIRRGHLRVKNILACNRYPH